MKTPEYWHKPRGYMKKGVFMATLYGRLGQSHESAENAAIHATQKALIDYNSMFEGDFSLKDLRKLMDAIRYEPVGTHDQLVDKAAATALGRCLMDGDEVDLTTKPDWWGTTFENLWENECPPVGSSIDAALALAGAYLIGFELVRITEDSRDDRTPVCVCKFEAGQKESPYEPVYQVYGQASTIPRSILAATVVAVVLIKYGSKALDDFLTTDEKDMNHMHGTDYL